MHAILYDHFDAETKEPSQAVLTFLHRSLTSVAPASIINALYFTANAMSESRDVTQLITTKLDLFQNLRRVMFTEPVHTGIISLVMWNLRTLATNRALCDVMKAEPTGDQLRCMFRAALTIENDNSLAEDMMASIREVTALDNEEFN